MGSARNSEGNCENVMLGSHRIANLRILQIISASLEASFAEFVRVDLDYIERHRE